MLPGLLQQGIESVWLYDSFLNSNASQRLQMVEAGRLLGGQYGQQHHRIIFRILPDAWPILNFGQMIAKFCEHIIQLSLRQRIKLVHAGCLRN
jgi:hypothetical protein